MSPDPPPASGGMAPIGTRREIVATLRTLNTGPQTEDGHLPDTEEVLYGPGIEIELPPGADPVTQMLLRLSDEDVGWDVVRAIAHRTHWRMLDPMSGRELRL